MIVMLLFLATGLIEDVVREGRHSLGYIHPNGFARAYLLLLVYYLSWKNDTWSPTAFLVLLIGVVLVAMLSKSRTGCALMIATSCIAMLYRRLAFRRGLAVVFGLLAIASVLCCVVYMLYYDGGNQIYVVINKFLSSRPYLTNALYDQYGFSLLGQKVVLADGMVLDPAYAHWLLSAGLIPTALILVGLIHGLVNVVKTGAIPFSVLAVCIFMIAGITESFPLSTSNLLLLFAGIPLFGFRVE